MSNEVQAAPVGYRDAASTRVQTELADGVFHIVLSREDARNAIDSAMADQLVQAALAVRQSDARCVLLRAQGRSFSVGGDVREFGSFADGVAVAETVDSLHDALRILAEPGVPIVSAVHGWCAGAGIGLACAADVVVVSESARFRSAYTEIGFTPDAGLTWILPRLVGAVRARDIILTNRVVSAQQAVDWGLASRLVPDDELEAQALEIATKLAAGARSALSTARTQLRRPDATTYFEALDEEAAAVKNAAASAEGNEGMNAFLSRRPALFH